LDNCVFCDNLAMPTESSKIVAIFISFNNSINCRQLGIFDENVHRTALTHPPRFMRFYSYLAILSHNVDISKNSFLGLSNEQLFDTA